LTVVTPINGMHRSIMTQMHSTVFFFGIPEDEMDQAGVAARITTTTTTTTK
jgi:hypothetical protein